MRIDPAGWPFIVGGFVLAAIATVVGGAAIGGVLAVLSAFFLFFFRDPDRAADVSESTVLAPADGRVLVAGVPTAGDFTAPDWKQVSVFLSPLDVHVNRMPVSGRITRIKYHPGRFLPAYRPDASDLNEYTEVTIDHGGQVVVVRQIVGILARRIVCRAKEGDMVHAGDRFGIMKFGSRMDVFIPTSSTIHVRVGDKVVAGVTAIATIGELPTR
jgi:phosphatidylserine decarboxylase